MTPYDQVAAVLAAATPGPWTTFGGWDSGRTIATTADHRHQWSVALDDSVPQFMREPGADARFIALARNTYPELLAVARAAEARRDADTEARRLSHVSINCNCMLDTDDGYCEHDRAFLEVDKVRNATVDALDVALSELEAKIREVMR
jgi:hypothetical protein